MKKISRIEFENLSLENQSELLTDQGQYISWKSEGEYNVYLYELDDFFAQAWMNIKLGKIIRIECSKKGIFPAGFSS